MRIVLALERVPGSAAALQPAVDLARGLDATLTTLFVEDPTLLASAALPMVQELDLATGAPQPFSAASLESTLRREAHEAERMLAAAARREAVPFTFRVVRDRLDTAARTEAESGDLVLLGLFARRGQPRTVPGGAAVAAYCAPGMTPARVLETAARLCRATGRPLALAAPPGERLRMQDLALVHVTRPPASWLPEAEPSAFLHGAAQRGAFLCVMAAGLATDLRVALRIRAGLDSTLLVLVD